MSFACLLAVVASIVPLAAQEGVYFETPRVVQGDGTRFPSFLALNDRLLVAYQETVQLDEESGQFWIAFLRSDSGREWERLETRIGPFVYGGTAIPFAFSALVHQDDTVFVAITTGAEETRVYRSDDRLAGFTPVLSVRTEQTNVAPRLFETGDGSIVLFVNQNLNGRQQIVYLHSADGVSWSDPQPFDDDGRTGFTFLPTHTTIGGRDFVVYQGLNISLRSTYQLYLKESDDGGRTWSASRRITDFVDSTLSNDPELFDNQRAYLATAPDGGRMLLAWERRFQTGSPQVYLRGFDPQGEPDGYLEEVTGRFDLARSPRIAFHNGEPILFWFTNPQGNSRVILGRRTGFRWQTRTLSPVRGEATFAEPIVYRGHLHLVWQRRTGEAGSEIVYAEPDQSVTPPTITPGNFVAGRRSASSAPRFQLVDPSDASGIRGYAYTWSHSPDAPVPQRIAQRVPNRTIVETADEDGAWYLRVRATDFAGNWSEPATIAFVLDTTPPGPIVFPPPSLDENGYLFSNTFQLRWEPPPEEEDLGGYTSRLDYIASLEDGAPDELPSYVLPARVTTIAPTLGADNADNGVWMLSVAAIDAVGNVGPATRVPLRLNKYVPVTRVFDARVSEDPLGRYGIEIIGRGFDSNGSIRQVVLDRDGSPPYDYEFTAWRQEFQVDDDRHISGVLVDEVETGVYRIGLLHPERGMYVAPEVLELRRRGTIKYGDFRPVFQPRYEPVESARWDLGTSDAVFWLVVAVAVAAIVFSSVRLVAIGGEIRRLNLEARALMEGKTRRQIEAGIERIKFMKTKGIGLRSLRIKFMFFVVLLVVAIVVLVAVVLGRDVLNRQERILVSGLQERVELLVEGLVAGARPALQNPQLNLDQLQTLTEQGEVMAEALYVTVSGIDAQGALGAIYGTSDPAIVDITPPGEGEESTDRRIDTDTYIIGISRIQDQIADEIDQLSSALNEQAIRDLGQIPIELERLSQEAQRLILRGAGENEIAAIDEVRTQLLARARVRLAELAGSIRSVPAFNFEELSRDQTSYLFYKPVLDIVQGAGAGFTNYYRGTIRVAVSTQLILDEIDSTRRDIIITTFVIAAGAVVAGILGAYILATIVVIPINRLVDLVTFISETEDKEELHGHGLQMKSGDELNVLANSINQMMEGLAKAAATDKDLRFGKETQKAFIPLEPISDDTKRVSGEFDEPDVYFFGYYEGAKGVSGDYFTYRKLNDRYYAVIKCDVAGKGIPAALIMVQVATIFQDYFRGWSVKRPGFDVSNLILRMNDIIVEQKFKGRFAALTAGIVDADTGTFYTANAGDTTLHVYRTGAGRVEEVKLAGGPAAGVMSREDNPMISYPQHTITMEAGDLLLLFTDGLEEAQRALRLPDFSPLVATEEMLEGEKGAEGVVVGQAFQEFSNERIHEIVAAVKRRGRYTLTRFRDPVADEVLEFDYSTCTNTTRDAVLAVVAAERLFRIYSHPDAGEEDKVRVDRLTNLFLKEHFVQFDRYFSHLVEVQVDPNQPEPEYVTYTHIREDEQFDDITMLAVERKR